MKRLETLTCILTALLAGLVLLPQPATAQGSGDAPEDAEQFFPRHGFLLSGYGAAGYNMVFAEGDNQPNNFSALFSPIMLFQISDRFLFEGELEFALEEGVTETELEYAQVDFSLTNNLTLVAGKFLLPFVNFSERYHPTWINRLVSLPAVYGGHHGGAGPTEPLLPVLADVGAQLRGSFPVGRFGFITAAAFVTQGPRSEAEHAADEQTAEEEQHGAAPEIVHGTTFIDNNEDKMIGGRVGFGLAPYFEVNASGMTGAYDAAGNLRFSALGVHAEGRYKNLMLHSELIQTIQEVPEDDVLEGDDTVSRTGYWIQTSYRWNRWEPLVRWSQIFDGMLGDETLFEAGQQLALGLDYWIEPSLFIKAEYLLNVEDGPEVDNNRVALQIAFGF